MDEREEEIRAGVSKEKRKQGGVDEGGVKKNKKGLYCKRTYTSDRPKARSSISFSSSHGSSSESKACCSR